MECKKTLKRTCIEKFLQHKLLLTPIEGCKFECEAFTSMSFATVFFHYIDRITYCTVFEYL